MVTLRPLTTADIPAHARLLAASEAVDRTAEHHSEADLAEEYADPDLVLGTDLVGAFDGDDLVGFFLVHARDADDLQLKCVLDGTVRPDRRGEGIGSVLAAAMLARADAAHAAKRPDLPARFVLYGVTSNETQAQLAADIGLTADRWSFSMRVELAGLDLGGDPALPAGTTLLAYRSDLDEELRRTHNEVFLDHPDFTPWTVSLWRQWVSGSRNFRPELTLLLVEDAAPDRIVAYVQAMEYDAHFQATGVREVHVSRVGTRREWRGRGVAGAMLGEALRRYREAGFAEASLDVDAQNPTGALGVYERLGFELDQRGTTYALERPPLTG